MLGLYGSFSLFVCFLGVRYLYFRLQEEAAARTLVSGAEKIRAVDTSKRNALIDDLPFLLENEKPACADSKKETSVLI